MRPAEPPSNQMALPGMGSEGEALMDEARRWVAAHYDEWQFWCATARRDGDETGYISSDAVTHMMRHRFFGFSSESDREKKQATADSVR